MEVPARPANPATLAGRDGPAEDRGQEDGQGKGAIGQRGAQFGIPSRAVRR
ncbi:hypothetical protein GCM10023324_04820 [Streptomyces youssoufiensis]